MKHTFKPCPCCAGEAQFKNESGSWGYYSAKYRIQCKRCGLCTPYIDDKEDIRPKNKISSMDEAKATAAAIWNKRAVESET